jgi:hypothetical protein
MLAVAVETVLTRIDPLAVFLTATVDIMMIQG